MAEPTQTAQLGRYTLLAQIAHGGMAEVYLARQDGPQGFHKFVVIKRAHPHLAQEKQFVQMFLDEARLVALIDHPNIASIYDLGEVPATGTYYMVMEYVDGRNLRQVADVARRRKRKLDPRFSARLVADACAGLHFAHELTLPSGEPLGIIHRDISPENLLVTYGGLLKIVDFGIAKAVLNEALTRTGQLKGKLAYLAPEQLQAKKVDRRCDVWALGVTLYWLLAGDKPFKGEGEAQVMRAVLETDPAPLGKRARGAVAEAIAELQPIVTRALEKDPAARYPTALALQEDLERFLGRSEPSDKPVTAAAVGAAMEKLFPKDTDPDRLRHRALITGSSAQEISVSMTGLSEVSAVEPPPHRASPPPPPGSRGKTFMLALLTIAATGAALTIARRVARERYDDASRPLPTTAAEPATAVDPGADAGAVAAVPQAALPTDDAGTEDAGEAKDAGAAPPVHAEAVPAAAPITAHASASTPAARENGERSSRLVVHARRGVTVLVDGERLGIAPVGPLSVSPGHHRVELVDEKVGPRSARKLVVDVRAGQTAVVR